ncbi:hypothetical protein B0A58_04780 [Flavobacterium branchiophilum NBRC 15030 = ATCC 35035]|uniref:Glycosyl transferase family 2 n=1 Tax=Flavobacterium branchiophilum TaxID=55197 RepID=A0A543G5A8_9FLAO|nr:glycosyltransferase family 2 protein [Flavobacterium branchiophilum]OXA78058.1 hypothetical protein B0A58_04780 [Flavobacterium branchiophilum NBRC 15030 = ATCC 35035]TQM41266.1 glycosyl transferase family 2 [Flavobacterium branchiophilum]GEM54860.1 hypothetical protein FB1_10810 [Flavobacterium branchiophilum NBRC 15030 = ATCC 35035]
MNPPLVSVIVPVYNVEKYLARCLDSIIHQTYSHVEIILINDGSPDSSGTICDAYAKKDSRIQVFHQENKGQSAARNLGVSKANGTYISFIDSDDWIELELIAESMALMLKNDLKIVEFRLKFSTEVQFFSNTFQIQTANQALVRIMNEETYGVPIRIYHKSLVKPLQFIDGKIFEDILYTFQIVSAVDAIGLYDKNLYHYFNENISTIRSSFTLKKLNHVEIFLETKQFAINKGLNTLLIEKIKKEIVQKSMNCYLALTGLPHLDPDKKNRIKLKNWIKDNYSSNAKFNVYTRLLRYLPMNIFDTIFKIRNKLIK